MSLNVVVAGAKSSGLSTLVSSFCGQAADKLSEADDAPGEYRRQVTLKDRDCLLRIRVCPQPETDLSGEATHCCMDLTMRVTAAGPQRKHRQ